MTAPPVRIRCRCCEQPGEHGGRGLCEPCYRKHDRRGDLDRFPSVRGDAEWRENYRLDSAAPAAPPRPPKTSTTGTWGKRAACLDADPELFFPVSETGGPHVEQAKAICQGCPVRTSCLERAVRAGEPAGIWGGLTTPERRRRRASQLERTSA